MEEEFASLAKVCDKVELIVGLECVVELDDEV
jgi:hypothetical protein